MRALPLFLALGCGGNDPSDVAEHDIVGGVAARGRHPAVLAIDIGGEMLCTGTLVAPRVVMTARHCVSQTTSAVACPAWGPQILGEHLARSLILRAGDDAATGEIVAVGESLVVPDSDVLCDADIAFLLLDRDVEGIVPLDVRREPVHDGDRLRVVGYGKTRDAGGAGKKRLRTNVAVTAVSDAEFVAGESACGGDSGGPALDDAGAIAGVVSRGGPGCEGSPHNVFTRADAFAPLLEEALGTQEYACGIHRHCPNGFRCSAPGRSARRCVSIF